MNIENRKRRGFRVKREWSIGGGSDIERGRSVGGFWGLSGWWDLGVLEGSEMRFGYDIRSHKKAPPERGARALNIGGEIRHLGPGEST